MSTALKLVAIVVLLSACQKKQCWKCTTVSTNYLAENRDSVVEKKSGNASVCDQTEDGIAKHEFLNSDSVVSGNLVLVKKTTCTEQ